MNNLLYQKRIYNFNINCKINSKGNKGVVTIEAALLFPIILLVVFYLLFVVMLQFQNVYLKSLAQTAGDMAVLSITEQKLNYITDYSRTDTTYIYSNLLKEKLHNEIESYVQDRLMHHSVLPVDKNNIKVVTYIENHIVYQVLYIKLTAKYSVPFSNLPGSDSRGYVTNNTEVSIVLNNTKEMTDNIDMAKNLLNKYGLADKPQLLIEKFINPVKTFLETIKQR